MTHPVRVVFAGTPAFSIPCLEALLGADSVQVTGVYTGPDRPVGRGQKHRHSAVKEFALQHNMPVFQPESLRQEDVLQQLRRLNPDLMVVVAYGLLLPPDLLAVPPLGCVNLHASLLPRWRGAAPIQRAIEAGDEITGVSLMRMEPGLDNGPVLARSAIPIAAQDTGGSLHDKLAPLAAELLAANLPTLAAHELKAEPQDESLACYAPKLEKSEGRLDWRLDAVALVRKVRAFNPWPAALVELGGILLKVSGAQVASPARTRAAKARPGEILEVDKTGITVATGEGALVLTEVQKPGGVPMPVAALLNGMNIKPGMVFTATR